MAPGASRDDGDLLNEGEVGGLRGRKGEDVAEGMEELRSGHALSPARARGERKCVEKQWTAQSLRTPPPSSLNENVTH